jgi:predicted molibdopterin-dependent oxidoreductase YjgC
MFKRIDGSNTKGVTLTIEGKKITAPAGSSVAAAMLTAGFDHFSTTPISGARRAPFCMMGTCFDCLVEIDGIPNRQACQTTVCQGMRVKLQHAARKTHP